MAKRRRYERSAANLSIYGARLFRNAEGKIESLQYYRGRKARRAQARLDGLVWRELSEQEKLAQ